MAQSFQRLQREIQSRMKEEEAARKAHDRQVFAVGRMVDEAGLLDLDDVTLQGMLGVCAEARKQMAEKWRAFGLKITTAAQVVKTPARATFAKDTTLSKEARVSL